MGKQHIRRLAAPRSWPIARKKTKYIVRPLPGPHALSQCLPMSVVLRDILNYAKTKKEVTFILNEGSVLVDKVVRKERRFPLGFMDVIEFVNLNKYFRIVYDKKGKLCLNDIDKVDSGLKICKVIGKKTLRNKKTQLNLSGGKNILVAKDNYKVGDSVVFDLEKKSIKDSLKLEKGVIVYLTGGKHVGYTGKVKDIIDFKGLQNSRIILSLGGKDIETLKSYAFVVGKDKPVVSLGEK